MNIIEKEKPENSQWILKEFLFLFLVLIVSCIFISKFVAPLSKDAKLMNLEIEIKEKNIESKKLFLSRMVKLNKKNETDIRNIEKINSLIPNRNNYEDYLAHIIILASNKNIIIDNFSISENQKKDKNNMLNSVKISFSASGGYSNFINFLEDIERSIPFIQVNSVVANVSANNNQETIENDGITGLIINFSVELTFNYY